LQKINFHDERHESLDDQNWRTVVIDRRGKPDKDDEEPASEKI
jgi:hypothetical protein